MNLYEVLHVSQDAPIEIIKLAYKGLAQKYHPDRYKGDDANEIMVRIREAYEVLSDPVKRVNYDNFLTEQARRKQQQEEYVRKQQQEEFARSQRESFKREANSSAQSQNNGTNTHEATKDFNINLSIKIPKHFSVLEVFIKFFGWLKSKKNIFIRVGVTCFTLYILAAIGVAVNNSLESRVSNATEEQIAVEEANAAAQETMEPSEELYEAANVTGEVVDYVEETADVSQEAVYVANALNTAAQEGSHDSEVEFTAQIEDANRQTTNVDELLVTKEDIESTVTLVLDIFQEQGMDGVKNLVSSCYQENSKSRMCLYFEVTANYIHQSGVAAGFPEYSYFDHDRIVSRMNKNFYGPNQIESHIGDGHLSVVIKRIGEYVDSELSSRGFGES